MRLWPALDVHRPDADDIEELQGMILAALDDTGISAVQELPDAWRFFFINPAARGAAAGVLRSLHPVLSVSEVDVTDEDWARRSQENLGPVRVGRVRIVPPWAAAASRDGETLPQPPSAIDIVIQPSMGFGTGHHATTRLCVEFLQQTDLVGRRVLDVGTGSGVLAIVAARLGADFVVGVDDDPDALESARENIELNGLTAGIVLQQADFRGLPRDLFDVVAANLTGGLLVAGVDALVSAVAPAGRLILSGITAEEEGAVRACYEARLALVARREEDGWVGLLLRGAGPAGSVAVPGDRP